ncbi:hypothetical protein F4780DRAFT_100178 [Xylariomycetidae sp. FL0641]|nr:hypothetical protein F4780DRAFT_100178 [Xylariomycetidae sp. FL0641]
MDSGRLTGRFVRFATSDECILPIRADFLSLPFYALLWLPCLPGPALPCPALPPSTSLGKPKKDAWGWCFACFTNRNRERVPGCRSLPSSYCNPGSASDRRAGLLLQARRRAHPHARSRSSGGRGPVTTRACPPATGSICQFSGEAQMRTRMHARSGRTRAGRRRGEKSSRPANSQLGRISRSQVVVTYLLPRYGVHTYWSIPAFSRSRAWSHARPHPITHPPHPEPAPEPGPDPNPSSHTRRAR